MAFDEAEISEAFERYCAAATHGGATGDWGPWVDTFVPDLHYVEHHFGEMHGRESVLAWITDTMARWPNSHMREFPWDWYTIDADQGWVVGQLQNRFVDPGDGRLYQAANWTRLVYAGEGLFASEEDVYNPAHFVPVVSAWLDAWATHHPDEPHG